MVMSWIVNKMPIKALILFWEKKYGAFSSVSVLSVCNPIVLNIFLFKYRSYKIEIKESWKFF